MIYERNFETTRTKIVDAIPYLLHTSYKEE